MSIQRYKLALDKVRTQGHDMTVATIEMHATGDLMKFADHREVVREATHILGEVVPLDGPMDLADVARKVVAALAAKDAEVAAQKLRADAAELRLHRDAARLADEVAALVQRGVVDSRSPVADALLDFREPPSTARADRLADLDAEVAAAKRVSDRVGCMAGFVVFAAAQLRAACEPFRCDTFGCETKETEALDKACAEVDRAKEPGLLAAAKAHLESVVAAAFARERAAILAALTEQRAIEEKHESGGAHGLGLAQAIVKARSRSTPGAAKEDATS